MAKLRLRFEIMVAAGIVSLVPLGAGCSSSAEADDAKAGATASTDSALLVGGSRETVIDSIASIENSMFSTTGRLFLTGDDGVYEVTRDATGALHATVRAASSGCKFAGIAETRGVLYVNCYDGTNSSVFAARLDDAPTFQKIYDLPGVSLANGAAADDAGRVYVADSTHGTIWRLAIDPVNPFAVTSREAFSTGNLFPNGLEVFGGNVYFTDFVAVKRIPLLANGTAGAVTTLASQLTFFDDLHVDDSGIVVANYLFGSVEGLTPNGVDLLDTASFGFSGPSSVLPAKGRLGFADRDLLVTEKTANRLSVFHLR
ncbi:MAG TPA: hypothetical protein VH062_32685 [Polyangiaceae bacterium]|jgi:hypothetical protein|nr:hypothetical protein [Polyangiaceae bacterium]